MCNVCFLFIQGQLFLEISQLGVINQSYIIDEYDQYTATFLNSDNRKFAQIYAYVKRNPTSESY